MKTFLFIVLVIAWVGYKSYQGVKKNFTVEDDADTTDRQETSRPAFESLFSEEEKTEREASFADEEREAGYFSYETIDDETAYADPFVAEQSTVEAPSVEPQQVSAPAVEPDQSVSEDNEQESFRFDLRQAVIYQTLLNNPFTAPLAYSR